MRDRAIVLTLFQSGIRVGTLCNLNFGHVKSYLYPELKIPIRLRITENIDTKLRGQEIPFYYTFLQEDACKALKEYCDKTHIESNDEKPLFLSKTGRRLNRVLVWLIVKKCVKRAGLDPESIWTHSLRKSFRKILNASQMDEDTKEAIMGHKLPGARGNYFDMHDIDEIERKYTQCNFSREVPSSRVEALERELHELRRFIEEIRNVKIENGKPITIPIYGLKEKKQVTEEGPELIKIDKHDVDKYIELRRKGYIKDWENDKVLVMIKE